MYMYISNRGHLFDDVDGKRSNYAFDVNSTPCSEIL